MAKFIQVKSPKQNDYSVEDSYYVNVETVRYVLQNANAQDRSAISFVGSEHSLHIHESAASFVSRAIAD
jgi:hypothetical protein